MPAPRGERTAGVLLAVLLAALRWQGASADTVLIHAGHLIDPATGEVAANRDILVRDGTIVAIEKKLAAPEGARVVDLSADWVMPGLMDAHSHLTYSLPVAFPKLVASYSREGTGLRALRGAYNARALLHAGFTAVRDVGNSADHADTDLRRAIEMGWFPGPTMLNAGKIIAPFGGQSGGFPPEFGPAWQFEFADADTPDEIRKAIRRNIYYGATVIKLVADQHKYHYTQADIAAAVDEAHSAGLKVAVHVTRAETARAVILGGADSIEHGTHLSDEMLRLMKQQGTFLVGTEFPEKHLNEMGINTVTGGKTMGRHFVDRLARAHKVGVKLVFGTDVIVDLPQTNRADMMFDYLDVWLAAGVRPAEILESMTTNAAALFGWAGKRGAIAVGEAADIIATPTNPLHDIHALRRVRFVMKNGAIVRQDH